MAARAVMEAYRAGLLQSKLDLVIFDRTGPTDSMVEYCTDRGISFRIILPCDLESGLLKIQKENRFDAMGLTFNRLIPHSVIEAFSGRIFNLHLSLLPLFPGFGATRKALKSGMPYTGVTVHFINAGIDTGPVIVQQKLAIEIGETEASLGRRQFEAAVPLLLQTIRLLEKQELPRFNGTDLDLDLVQFSTAYCDKI
jgi:phosphoribosylglycinamide formyltransferase-1